MRQIQFGVVDHLYQNNLSTSDVAQYLEDKYGILQSFTQAHIKDIMVELDKSYENAMREMAAGLPVRDPFGSAMSKITDMMRKFISSQEVERQGIKGVPTLAALQGKSSRFKSGFKNVSMAQLKRGVRQGSRRPSFIDTGLYESSLIAYMKDK